MILNRLIHPIILGALAQAGHGSTILITDGHYPAGTAVGNNATTVNLNLEAGVPTVSAVFPLILATIPVERLTLFQPSADALPSQVQEEIDEVIAGQITREFVDRSVFYDAARSLNLALCIVTGDLRRFANVLLTVGVLGVTPSWRMPSVSHATETKT
jgi:L-fucose mutarotase